MSISNDPFQTAVETAERSGHYYGQMSVGASFVILVKGVGKSTYNEANHDIKDRRTEVSMALSPIDEMNMSNLVQRSMLSESAEWSRIVWPSLRDGCGLSQLRDLDGKHVKVELVKNGRTWTDKKTGEPREGTTFKFLALYPNKQACVDAYFADGGTDRSDNGNDSGDSAMAVSMAPGAGTINPELETAKAFLPALVKQAAGNKSALETMLNGMPMIAKYFNVNSPEVVALMAA